MSNNNQKNEPLFPMITLKFHEEDGPAEDVLGLPTGLGPALSIDRGRGRQARSEQAGLSSSAHSTKWRMLPQKLL